MKHPATLVVLVLAAALAPVATAGSGPHGAPSTSSIAQYVEQVPSASGSVPLGQGSGAAARLTPAAQKALSKSGGSDASTLQKVAVDPQYGAPSVTPSGQLSAGTPAATRTGNAQATDTHGTSKAKQGASKAHATTPTASLPAAKATGPAPPAHVPSALSAAGSTFGGNSLLALAVVLVAVTAGGVLLARRQRGQ